MTFFRKWSRARDTLLRVPKKMNRYYNDVLLNPNYFHVVSDTANLIDC